MTRKAKPKVWIVKHHDGWFLQESPKVLPMMLCPVRPISGPEEGRRLAKEHGYEPVEVTE